MLAREDLFLFERWWGYYISVVVFGGLGAALGSWLHENYKTDTKRFQQMLQGLLVACGLFFLLSPS